MHIISAPKLLKPVRILVRLSLNAPYWLIPTIKRQCTLICGLENVNETPTACHQHVLARICIHLPALNIINGPSE